MPTEPVEKKAVAFVDGQNLFHAVKNAFGYTYPNFDVGALAKNLCARQGWILKETRFYTGIPAPEDDALWNRFWIAKMAAMGRQGVTVYSRRLCYRNRRIRLPDGTQFAFLAGEEKGIDVRIAIDVIRMAHQAEYDVAILFSQDQDLSEVAKEVRVIAREQDRWIKVAAAYPDSLTASNHRGIDATDWLCIDKAFYDACVDPRDYRV